MKAVDFRALALGLGWLLRLSALGLGRGIVAALEDRLVLRSCAAQQPDSAAPHAGVPEIGAARFGCCADAVVVCRSYFNTVNQTPFRDVPRWCFAELTEASSEEGPLGG